MTDTVEALRGDAEKAVKQIALTAEHAHALIEDVRPEIVAMARNGSRITSDTREIIASINHGTGTIGKLVNDDGLYKQMRQIAEEAQNDDGERAGSVGGGAPRDYRFPLRVRPELRA